MLPAHRSRVRHSVLFAIFGVVVCFGSAHAIDTPVSPFPLHGSVRQAVTTTLYWHVSGAPGANLRYDLYWGTDPEPPLYALNVPFGNSVIGSYPLGLTSYSTQYYWRVVVRDSQGASASSDTWSYTTKAVNELPDIPQLQAPADGAAHLPVNLTLDYGATDFEGPIASVDLFLGTNPTPPLFADDVSPDKYKPAGLTPATPYYWRVVARDMNGAETSGPTWTFITAGTANRIPDTPSDPYPLFEDPDALNPILSWDCDDPDGEALTFKVFFGSTLPNELNPLPLIGTTTARQFQVGPLVTNQRYYWRIDAQDSYWTVKGPLWYFDRGTVPVLFSRFAAHARDGVVELSWSLQSDEAMDRYTLFRREATGPMVAIANEPVQGTDGSHLDTSVKAGKSYAYELVIRTKGGDEFRSQTATVTMPATGITLSQNVPNPFNPQTTIRYELPSSARVRLSVVDVAGRHVRTLVDEQQAAGSRSVVWAGRDDMGRPVSSGVYFYVLDAGKTRLTKKLVLLK